MKRALIISAATAAMFLATSSLLAQQTRWLAPPSAPSDSQLAAYYDNAPQQKEKPPEPGTAKKEAAEETDSSDSKSNCGCQCQSSCGSQCQSSCGCEASCGCGNSGCCCDNDWCDLGLECYWPFCCCCKPGEPCTLEKHLTPCCKDVTYGGWLEMGYHSQNTGLSVNDGDGLDPNDYPGHAQLQQAYFYVEKKAKTDSCCCDWGYRWDIVYGTNGDTVQAFGNQNNGWDKAWDHGAYGWAMPQAYVELGWNDWSVKVGHFYTIVGYEVFPANGNFFYSHSLSWNNSEPFTHTGALGTYTPDKCNTYYVGYTLGWDTAFDSYDGGSNYLGGFTHKFSDDLSFSYLLNVGNFGQRSNGDFGYEHTVILDAKLSKKWEYVMENDIVHTDDSFGGTGLATEGNDYEVANYLLYTINDCWKTGLRAEWWKSNQVTGRETSFYELTYGINYKPNANLVIRPEVRYDWTPAENTVAGVQGNDFYNKVIFGIDAVMTY